MGRCRLNAFAPEPGESCFALAAKFPGSMLGGETVHPVSRSDGTTDLYIARDPFHDIFCADVPASHAALTGATQRPATQEALVEPSGTSPLWKELPSWFLVGEDDRIIPAAVQHFMAERAGARRAIEISHAPRRPADTYHPGDDSCTPERVTPPDGVAAAISIKYHTISRD